jgi:tetratricopeptide (TPR) repeat protein
MGFFGKKKPSPAPLVPSQPTVSPTNADPRSDPNLIQVFDGFGRELFITKEQWRINVLPGSIKTNWNNADQLYGIIVGSLKDGFFSDLLGAAEHLYRTDPVRSRGACTYGIVLTKNNRLNEAEDVYRSYLQKHGDDGYVLTNLAKVFAARNQSERTEATLWHALEVDPNQSNALDWYTAIYRERSEEKAGVEALHRIAALSGSWRAQLWLARTALDAHDLEQALGYYRESLSRVGDKIPADFLVQMGGDLGKHGYLRELLQLTEPRFVPELHGLQVGNNLIKAHLDLGEIEPARKLLDELYALKRPDYKQHLSFWDTEIAKARVGQATTADEPPVSIAIAAIEGPVWLKPSSPGTELFPSKVADAPVIGFLGSSAEVPSESEKVRFQMADAPGRMSRALPLFLAEQVWFRSQARVQSLMPWLAGKANAFVLSGVPWRDEDAATYSVQAPMKSDFIVTTHLKTKSEPWVVELRLIRSGNRENLGELTASLQSAEPEGALLDLARRLLLLIATPAQLETQAPPAFFQVPTGANFPAYLLRLEQLLSVMCAGMEGVGPSFLSGEREIVDGSLQLCVACPENVGVRILFARALLGMKKIRPDLISEFKDRITLLQQKKPLRGPANDVLQGMFNEALTL